MFIELNCFQPLFLLNKTHGVRDNKYNKVVVNLFNRKVIISQNLINNVASQFWPNCANGNIAFSDVTSHTYQ